MTYPYQPSRAKSSPAVVAPASTPVEKAPAVVNEPPAATKVLSEAKSFVTAGALAAKPDIIVKLNPNDKDAKSAEEHLAILRARGFVVPVMQPDFFAVHMGPKLVAKLAKQLGPEAYKSMNKNISLRVQLAQKATEVLVAAEYPAADIMLAHDMGMIEKLNDNLGPFKGNFHKTSKKKGALGKKPAAIESGAVEETKSDGKGKGAAQAAEAPATNFPGLDLQSYFGSKVALYFTWLSFYNKAIIPVALFGLFQHFCRDHIVSFLPKYYAGMWKLVDNVIMGIWTACFVKFWTRHGRAVSFEWGVYGLERATEQAVLAKRAREPGAPNTFSLILVLPFYMFMVGSNCVVVLYLQHMIDHCQPGNYLPLVLTSLWPMLANALHDLVAPMLNKMQNWPTAEQAERVGMFEKFAFHFMNYYGAMFYVVFAKHDMARAKEMMVSFLITKQIIRHIMSFVVKPLTALAMKIANALLKMIMKKKKKKAAKKEGEEKQSGEVAAEDEDEDEAPTHAQWGREEVVEELRKQVDADPWVTSEEYLELIVQYGYMAFFATLYPIAPAMILVNNMLEYYLDQRDLLQSQRPVFVEREGLGAWRSCLIFISSFAALVNCGILWIELENDSNLRHQATELWRFTGGEVFMPLDFEHSNAGRVALAVIIEHFIIVMRWAIDQISDTPSWVREQAALNDKLASEVHKAMEMGAKGSAKITDANGIGAQSIQIAHMIPRGDANLDKARANVRMKLAPVFGVPPSVLLPLVLGPLMAASFKCMPFGIHELWLVIPVVLCIGGYSIKKQRLDSEAAIGIVSDPDLLKAIHTEMPAWWTDSNVDRVRWINQLLDTMWPSLDQGVSKTVLDSVNPILERFRPSFFSTLAISDLSLGTIAPKITSAKAAEIPTGESESVNLDLELKWAADLFVVLSIGSKNVPLKVELSSIQLTGMLRVMLGPMIPRSPYIGAVSLAFLDNPKIDFDFTIGGLDLMETGPSNDSSISKSVKKIIANILSNLMVYPKYLVINLAGDESLNDMSNPMPVGILRLTIRNASSVPPMDYSLIGAGSCDPFVEFTFNGRQYTTKIIDNDLNPVWNQTFDLLVHDYDTQSVTLELMDHDTYDANDPIGNVQVKISEVHPGEVVTSRKLLELCDGVKITKGSKAPTIDIAAEFLPLSEVDLSNPQILFKDEAAVDEHILADSSDSASKAVANVADGAAAAAGAGGAGGADGTSNSARGFFWDDPEPDSPPTLPAASIDASPRSVDGTAYPELGVLGVYNLSISELKPLSSGKDPLQGKQLLFDVSLNGREGEEEHMTKPRRKGEDMQYPDVFQMIVEKPAMASVSVSFLVANTTHVVTKVSVPLTEIMPSGELRLEEPFEGDYANGTISFSLKWKYHQR